MFFQAVYRRVKGGQGKSLSDADLRVEMSSEPTTQKKSLETMKKLTES